MKMIASKFPESIKAPLRPLRNKVRAMVYRGNRRICPVCGKSSRRFLQYGLLSREDAQRTHCGALERHRLMWIFVKSRTNLFNGQTK